MSDNKPPDPPKPAPSEPAGPEQTARLSESTLLHTGTPQGTTPPPRRPGETTAGQDSTDDVRLKPPQTLNSPPPLTNSPPPPTKTSNTGDEPSIDGASNLPQTLQGRYKLVRVLGKGGFANVYLAHDSVLDQDVAIKILKLGLASKADTDRFLFEARIGAKLRHHNIAQVFDIIQTPDGLQMIMEYYPNGTLADRIKKKGPMRARLAIDVVRQCAAALAYAHKRNFVHRDIKPANIFFSHDGIVKLGDFGIAAQSDFHEYTATGMIIGTPMYMAPEQSQDSRDVDPRADIYALGLTLYYMLTAKSPRVVDLDLIPPPFRKLIKSSTAQDRNDRLVSCEQFNAMLDQIEAEIIGSPATAGPTREPNLSETVIEPSRATGALSSTVTRRPPGAEPPDDTGEPISNPTPLTPNTSTLTGATLLATQGPTVTSSLPQTDPGTRHPSGVQSYLMYIIVAAGFVLIAAVIFISLRTRTVNHETDAANTGQLMVSSPSPEPSATPIQTPFATPTPLLTPEPTTTPTPEPTATPAPTATPPPTPEPTPPPPSPNNNGALGATNTGQPPAPPNDGRPAPLSLVLSKRRLESERIARALDLLKGAQAGPNPVMQAELLNQSKNNLIQESQAKPQDTLTRLLAAIVLHRLGDPDWTKQLHYAMENNRNSAQRIGLNPTLIKRDLALDAKDDEVLAMLTRLGPPGPGGQGGPGAQSGPGQRPGGQGQPPGANPRMRRQ